MRAGMSLFSDESFGLIRLGSCYRVLSTKLRFIVLDQIIFPYQYNLKSTGPKRNMTRGYCSFVQARDGIACALCPRSLQALEVFTCEAFSLFLEHSMAEWGRGDSDWSRVEG